MKNLQTDPKIIMNGKNEKIQIIIIIIIAPHYTGSILKSAKKY